MGRPRTLRPQLKRDSLGGAVRDHPMPVGTLESRAYSHGTMATLFGKHRARTCA